MLRSPVAGGSVSRRAAWPLSFALHAAAGSLLLLAPLAFDAALPEVGGAAFASVAPPLRLPVVVTVRPRSDAAEDGGPSRDRRHAASTRSASAAPAGAASPTDTPPAVPTPDSYSFGETESPADPPVSTGSCLVGCGTASPGPFDEASDDGPGSGRKNPVLRAGVDVRPPRPLRQPAPEYPELARAARVEGRVRVECVLGPDGRVRDVHVLEGPALLAEAALEAVRRWAYTPTLLRGVPVAVQLEVTVDFRLR